MDTDPRDRRRGLTENQRTVLLLGAVMLLVMSVVPPWQLVIREGDVTMTVPLERSPIFSPPVEPRPATLGENIRAMMRRESPRVRVDFGRLFLQWAAVLVITSALLLLLRETPSR